MDRTVSLLLISLASITCVFGSMRAQVLITEFQAAPADPEPEWVEVHNVGTKAVTLTDWQLCDERSCTSIPSLRLNAGQIAVFTKDPDALLAAYAIPSAARVVEVSLPSLNNTTDAVVLQDPDGVVMDQVVYDLGDFEPPRSAEREGSAADEGTNYSNRWTPSISRNGATPGALNSVVVLEDDVGISALETQDHALAVVLQNQGRTSVVDLPIYVTIDTIERRHVVEVLGVGSSASVQIPLSSLGWPGQWGSVYITIRIGRADNRGENDTLSARINTPPPTGTIVINEIMFDPWADGSDYVEIVNTGSSKVDVGGWTIEDERGDRGVIPWPLVLPPGGYQVIANSMSVQKLMDSGVPAVLSKTVNLNSTGDLVLLRSGSGFRVDEVEFQDDWHLEVVGETKGLSLEKLSPALVSNSRASWATSTDVRGGTPGAPNSAARPVQFTTTLAAQPNPFSTDRRERRHPAVVSFTQPFRHAIARMTVCTTQGRAILDLLNGALIGTSGGAVWDGRDGDGLPVVPGPYVIVLECVDAVSNAVHHATAVVVVGE